MKSPKQRIIFSNYNECYNEVAKESLIETHLYEFPNDKDWEPDKEAIYEEASFLNEVNWENFKNEFSDFIDGREFIIQGTVGTWNGNMEGGATFCTFEKLSQAWKDCDYIKLYDENGRLYLKCDHHDGTNHFEIRELNDRGVEYLRNHIYDDEKSVHDKLMTSQYSRLPHYAHKVYGCPKKEYEEV